MDIQDHLPNVPRWRAGAWGGGASSLSQFIGQDLTTTVDAGFDGDFAFFIKKLTVFIIATVALGTLGAIVARFFRTDDRWKLFLAGAAATGILTMALPALKPLVKRVDISLISSAYASDNSPCTDRARFTVGKGLKSFFGLDDPQYRVVIGSFQKIEDAKVFAQKINGTDGTLKAVVGEKAPCNDFYAVTVNDGKFLSLDQAKRLQNRVLSTDGVTGAYLSPEW